ncbi:MAG TPA: M20/M25/M40 family metallo-hydrolase [Gemmataceae bacterium]|nr:M20/M25/M40 family metallo-hydrolase [Gemmataceae bacterium]
MRHPRFAPSRPWLAAAVLLTAAAVGLRAQAPPAAPATESDPAAAALDKKLIAQAKDGSEVMTNLTYLSDVIGPRLTGSENLKKANEWAAEKMKSYGLSNVRLEPWTIPVGWQRGPATAKLIEPDNGRTLTVAAMGWTPGTKGPVEGEVLVLRARNKDDLVKYKGKLKNAIILQGPPANVRPVTEVVDMMADRRRGANNPPAQAERAPPAPRSDGQNRPADPNRPADKNRPADQNRGADASRSPGGDNQPRGDGPAGFGPLGDPQRFAEMRAFRNELREFLRTEGAAVMVMDAAKPHGLLNMTGGWRSERGADRASAPDPLPTLFMTHDHYALLYRLATRPAPAQTRVSVDINNTFVPGPVTVYNTVGELPGSEKPDEYVVVGAHLDSWDLGQGTTDNGTGTCVVLETARILSKSGIKPKRTIRFCLFTGEEQGLYGSKAFVANHKDDLARTSMAIVHDTGTGRVTAITTQGHEPLKAIFEKELTALKDLGVKEINSRRMMGSDHQSFDGAGVPGVMFQQDPAEYRLTHHSQSDTLDKAKEPDLIQGAQVMAVMAARVANLPSMLPREAPRQQRRGAE